MKGKVQIMRRGFKILIVLALILGAATAVYFLKPVNGPTRDLTLVADVARGNYVMRLGWLYCLSHRH